MRAPHFSDAPLITFLGARWKNSTQPELVHLLFSRAEEKEIKQSKKSLTASRNTVTYTLYQGIYL